MNLTPARSRVGASTMPSAYGSSGFRVGWVGRVSVLRSMVRGSGAGAAPARIVGADGTLTSAWRRIGR